MKVDTDEYPKLASRYNVKVGSCCEALQLFLSLAAADASMPWCVSALRIMQMPYIVLVS